ncbi:MAG: His/Gly/Thr/Pro-type tRNA ligase C-terminal domain-containing protein, partial [Columbia Basin potato purple top phytoplasma]
ISIFSHINKQKYILGGGGNYNNLIKEFSGYEIKSIGFAFGIERLMDILDENMFFENYKTKYGLDVYLFTLNEMIMLDTLILLRKIRQNNIKSEMNYKIFNFKKQLRKILELKPKYIIFIGQKEMENNKVNIKNISDQTTFTINKNKIINFLKEGLNL